MEMEVDDVVPAGEVSNGGGAVYLCCVTQKGLKRVKVPLLDSGLTFDGLKGKVLEQINSWEWENGNEKPKEFDILHQSRTVLNDEQVGKIEPLSILTIVKKDPASSGDDEPKYKSAQFISEYAASHHINDQIRSCSLALRTAFLNAKFITMMENLGDPDSGMLENIFATVPELKNDPVAIGIIQDPSLIFHLCDAESLKKLASRKPWIIEAFNFLAASIHNDRDASSSNQLQRDLFNAMQGDDGMDDDDEDGAGLRPSGSRITRDQLSAALNALVGGGNPGSSGIPASNAFGGLFQPPAPAPQAPRPNPGVAAAGANIQNLMNTLTGASGGAPGQPLSNDMVARAVTDALRRLTPEQRRDQIGQINSFVNEIQNQARSSAAPAAAPTAVSPPTQPPPSGGSSLSQQYQDQLRQMRDLGITDQRLSILALRVSEGDVNTAAELIFSGWNGEGSDPME